MHNLYATTTDIKEDFMFDKYSHVYESGDYNQKRLFIIKNRNSIRTNVLPRCVLAQY